MPQSLNNKAEKPALALLRLRPKAEGTGAKESAGAGERMFWVSLCIPMTSVPVTAIGRARGD